MVSDSLSWASRESSRGLNSLPPPPSPPGGANHAVEQFAFYDLVSGNEGLSLLAGVHLASQAGLNVHYWHYEDSARRQL